MAVNPTSRSLILKVAFLVITCQHFTLLNQLSGVQFTWVSSPYVMLSIYFTTDPSYLFHPSLTVSHIGSHITDI